MSFNYLGCLVEIGSVTLGIYSLFKLIGDLDMKKRCISFGMEITSDSKKSIMKCIENKNNSIEIIEINKKTKTSDCDFLNPTHKKCDEWEKILLVNNICSLIPEVEICYDSVILCDSIITTYISSDNDLRFFLNKFGMKVDIAKSNDEDNEYMLIQKRLTNKNIYMYGSCERNNKFYCKAIGSNKNEVIDEVCVGDKALINMVGVITMGFTVAMVYRAISH